MARVSPSHSLSNPLHKDLNELGRFYKSVYIFRYSSQVDLWKPCSPKWKTRATSSKGLCEATPGNSTGTRRAAHHNQPIAEGCKRLIINSIIITTCYCIPTDMQL
ncbi:Tn3 family transposase [Cytophagaceae bacterium SJW1-29]|uniref:Tn3 family transposase n=1 Tax=Salmonirosea aquatica TaxID=2654236 RepID=A0A7C9FBZ5_9BACT|nr:Tn3 family transposase [Cytophagaceae bacterium SJW1-29]